MIKQNKFEEIKKNILNIKKNIKEIENFENELQKIRDETEKNMLLSQISSLKKALSKTNNELKENIEKISLTKKLNKNEMNIPKINTMSNKQNVISSPQKKQVYVSQLDSEKEPQIEKTKKEDIGYLEKQIIKRLKKKEVKKEVKKEREASYFVGLANSFFSGISKSLLEKGMFRNLKRDLVKANMQFLARSYISVILFSTLISVFASILVFLFFLFFNFGAQPPFITPFNGNIISRIGTIFWIMIIIPLGTFIIAYLYPSMEKKTIEMKINRELPFATIHMASISESLVEPTNIFKIVVSTKEYPVIEKEFIKLLNEVNVFGYDLVTALRNAAFNSPSKKLSELLDGLATTITSGGNLSEFFDKRAQTLLFEHKLDKEKQTKSAETFMDIYISVVIAAPMILMLLLIIMRVSGLGISLSTTMISIIMVLGVSVVNIVFIVFLQLKQQY